MAFCSIVSLQVYDACGGEGGDIQLGFLLCLIIIGCEKCMWGRERGYTGWFSTVSYHHCKFMMHVGEGDGIYSLTFCSVFSLQVYDACGGGGGDIQLRFLLCHIIIGCEKCMWGRGRGYTASLSTVSYHHCKLMMHVVEGEGINSFAFCCVLSSLQVYDVCGGEGGDIQLGFLLCLISFGCEKCMWGRGRGYTAWLSALSKSSLHVYDACGGGGGDIQLGFLLCLIIASV